MTPLDPGKLNELTDQLANALQVVVLVAEHLERASSATAQGARAINRNLQRVRTALERLQAEGGAR